MILNYQEIFIYRMSVISMSIKEQFDINEVIKMMHMKAQTYNIYKETLKVKQFAKFKFNYKRNKTSGSNIEEEHQFLLLLLYI